VSTSTSPRNASWIWSSTQNALGEVIQTNDPATDTTTNLLVTQSYDAAGDVLTVLRNAGNGAIATTYQYDALGRKTSQSDPDSGTTSATYNAAGDVISSTDARTQTVTVAYDAMGRRYTRYSAGVSASITDYWNYDTAANGYGQLASESRPAFGSQQPYSRSYGYDGQGRLSQRTTTLNVTQSYTETTAYDAYGRVLAQSDASGYAVTPHYTANGYVDAHTDGRTGAVVYQVNAMNARAQVVSDQRAGTAALGSTLSYNAATGRLSTICTGTSCALQNLAYNFDLAGDLTARSHGVSGQTLVEYFGYDALNRLTTAGTPVVGSVTTTQSSTAAMSLAYDALGNICSKTTTSLGTQTYGYAGAAGCATHGTSGSPHAVTTVSGASYAYDANGNQTTSSSGRTLNYDPLNQLVQAQDTAGDNTSFQYNEGGERFQRTDVGGVRTIYLGAVQIIASGGLITIERYLPGGAIDYVRSSAQNETRYVFNDHLGSTDVVASSTGTLIEATSFDAHGLRRNATNWSGSGTPTASTTHGFTSHEQLDSLNLVHMNGRVYDPTLGRMLQADPVKNPGSQGLNRYSYVANHPLSLTDPSGYSWFSSLLEGLVHVAIDAVALFYGGPWGLAAVEFTWTAIQTGSLQSGLFAAFSAFASAWIGGQISIPGAGAPIGDVLIAYTERALAMGITSGVLTALQGGNFGSVFASAALSSLFMPDASKNLGVGDYLQAAVVGGTASRIVGGKFANGAETAVFQLAAGDIIASHAAHEQIMAEVAAHDQADGQAYLQSQMSYATAFTESAEFNQGRYFQMYVNGDISHDDYMRWSFGAYSDPTLQKIAMVGTGGMLAITGVGLALEVLGAGSAEESFFSGASYTQKVLSQMSQGAGEFHSFPEAVAAFEGLGTTTAIVGGDGAAYTMLEIEGGYAGRQGAFQFIKNVYGEINHRLFVPTPPP